MDGLEQTMERVHKSVEWSVIVHGNWRDYTLGRMLRVICGEVWEVVKAMARRDIYGTHGVVNELRDVAVTCIKAVCVLSSRRGPE